MKEVKITFHDGSEVVYEDIVETHLNGNFLVMYDEDKDLTMLDNQEMMSIVVTEAETDEELEPEEA